MMKVKNLLGKKFNHWEVLNFSYINKKHGAAYWACQCDLCGRIYNVRNDHLQAGESTKCRKCAAAERRGSHARIV